jgi:plastocyanin
LAAAVLILAAACGGGGAAATQGGGDNPPASAAASCTGSGGSPVAIAGSAYNPISVTVAKGGTVTWTNSDATTHTVTFDAGPDCGRLPQGATVSRTFSDSGTFTYHCMIHSFMKGTVVVQ